MNIRQHGKRIPDAAYQLIRIDVAALHEPRAEKEVLAEKDDALSRGADTEFILVLAHIRELSKRGGGDEQAHIPRALIVTSGRHDTVSVAAGRAQSRAGKHEIDALEKRLAVILCGCKYGVLRHSGNPAEFDGILQKRKIRLWKSASLPYIHFIAGVSASERHASLIFCPAELHGILRQP